ncbi:hypothetical protein GOODEAATRI_014941 [Goodea atripinnis]|uniref:Uncharacterized protein n=1 Tax=Goodea atripinnis TaxID=208336 RepID=A0ABV0N1L4_9TELE
MLLPAHDPQGQRIVERANMVGKLKERKYNSQSVHRRAEGKREWKEEWNGRPGDIFLRGMATVEPSLSAAKVPAGVHLWTSIYITQKTICTPVHESQALPSFTWQCQTRLRVGQEAQQ